MTDDKPHVIWSPQPGPQSLLVTCPIEDVFYGGARGGGKSDGLLGDFALHAQAYGEHANGYFFRKTYDDLDEAIRRSLMIFTPAGWNYNKVEHRWTAPNGATLTFRYLESPEDTARYMGFQMTWLAVDQVEQFPDPAPIDRLWGSIRSVHGVKCVRRLTGNPPAPPWLFARYVEPHPRGLQPFVYRPLPTEFPSLSIEAIFIPAKLEDNPLLMQQDPDYERRLAASGSKELFQAWRFGRWDVMIGAVFSEWRPDLHILPDDFVAPKNWIWAAGCDWGYRNPGWFGWFACGPDGDVVCMDEVYFREQTAQQVGYACGLRSRELPALAYIAADEQMWYKTGVSAPTIAEEFQAGFLAAYGGDLERCPKLVEAGHGRGSRSTKLQVTHRYLRWTAGPDGKVPPWGRPRLRFLGRCRAAVRTLPALPYDTKKPEDVDTNAEDHAYDGVAAFLMSRPPLAEALERPHDPERHPGVDHRTRRRKQWERSARQYLEEGAHLHATDGFRVPRAGEAVPLDER